MKLLIVESPAKAKTIEKYLHHAYTVKASVGHIRDLPKSNKKAIDIEAGFVPHYEISKGKNHVVEELRTLAKKADEIVLATDPDREGEAIAWHIYETLGLEAMQKKEKKSVSRVAFHEITEEAVNEALKHPRDINTDLRRAQEARRVLDRLFGYDLSGLIWQKVRYGLSAGRVQSPALRILMERERDIRAFIPETYFVLTGIFGLENIKDAAKSKIKIEDLTLVCEEEPKTQEETERILNIGRTKPWQVAEVKESEMKRAARPPFTTSTLQQAASSRLGFSPSRTMGIAQKLYESGYITYMRTDSTTLSQGAQTAILSLINKKYGKEYANPTFYKTKSKNAQEAHEAIRPSHPQSEIAGTTEEQKKLYRLIWQRTVASQMTSAKLLKTKVRATTNTGTESKAQSIPYFSTVGSRVLFDGWFAADPAARSEDVELPVLAQGDPLKLINLNSEEKSTTPPDRYSEAGLVKELEKRGIGRPSTYASIIKTIQDRGYVEKEGKALKPTDTGEVVSDFLEKNFENYISDSFTAKMEDELDDVALGQETYEELLTSFYGPFTEAIKEKEKLEKATNLGEADPAIHCPTCDGPMIIKLSKGGKFLSCARFPDCQGARTIDGLELEGPKEIGEACPKCGMEAGTGKAQGKGGKLVVREGRFGKFVSCSRYPKCKFIRNDEEEEKKKQTGVACPDCIKAGRTGQLIERRGRFGIFYSCSEYPECKLAIKAKPTGRICELCQSLMMEGTKTIPERCSNKSCPNHNPHKLAKE